jgi:hypothetical protein
MIPDDLPYRALLRRPGVDARLRLCAEVSWPEGLEDESLLLAIVLQPHFKAQPELRDLWDLASEDAQTEEISDQTQQLNPSSPTPIH